MKVLCSNLNKSFTIKKSKFLCFAYFINSKEEVKEHINQLKKEYPDASHICYAYILDDKTYYYTDAGEPSGTAGKPIYGGIVSNKLNYVLFVVIRYFGGIKFGPGPLRATYKDVTIQTLQNGNCCLASISDIIKIKVPYSDSKLVQQLKHFIYKKDFQKEFIIISLIGDEKQIKNILSLSKIQPFEIQKNQLIKQTH